MKILVNLDCVSNNDGRSVTSDDYDSYHEAQADDQPNTPLIQLLRALSEEYDIFVYTAMPERFRLQVEDWLITNEVPADDVLMRSMGDYSKAKDCLVDAIMSCDKIHTVIERDTRIIEAMNEEGIHVLVAC